MSKEVLIRRQRLKKYINLARKHREKYRDLNQRQAVKIKHSPELILGTNDERH